MNFFRNLFKINRVRGKSGTVRRLFFTRAEAFTIETRKILSRMKGAQEAIEQLIEETESYKDGGVLQWNEVSLIAADQVDPLIILVGIIRFPPGAEVPLQGGDKVIVTKDTAEYFVPRLVRIGLPLNLAEASKEEVYAYLKKAQAEQDQDIAEMEKTIKDVLATDPEVETKKAVNDTVTTDTEFDLSQLTDEQRRELKLTTKMGRG